MEQALDPTAYIYEGFWRNLSKATTRSLTLTLCPTRAVILTNALALFVAMSGGQLWTIIRFTLHQIRATSRTDDNNKTFNQQQVVLRNATTDIATARLMLYLAWTSRRNARAALTACVTILVLAVLNAVFFMIAGTFSNSLVNAGSTVLSRSPHCGFWNQTYLDIAGQGNNPTNDETFVLSTEYISKEVSDMELNIEYARNCYMNPYKWYWDSSCGVMEKSRLNWTSQINTVCPFEQEACSHHAKTLIFDTGLIDTHSDLGINAPIQDRLKYRRVTQCTILNDTAFTTDFVNQTGESGVEMPWQIAFAEYGASSAEGTDFTYSYSNFVKFYTNFTGQNTQPYQVGNAFAYGEVSNPDIASSGTFIPIDQLNKPDADVLLVFLSFIGRYLEPIDDPWFSAHQVSENPTGPGILQTLFEHDRPISTMGCTEQHQICTSPTVCSDLLGYDQMRQDVAEKLSLTPNQAVTFERLKYAATWSSMWAVIQDIARSSAPVLAINSTATASYTVSLPLPDNQWQLELDRWHSIAMARLQRTIEEFGTGQIAPQVKYLLPPKTAAEKWICDNLRIQSTVYQSFNVVALVLVIIFGALIILCSLRIETISAWIQLRLNRGGLGRDMWNDHDMLGRQRWRTIFETPAPSLYPGSPHTHMSSPFRNMELRYLQTQLPTGNPHARMNQSPRRASSQALSPGDSARFFPDQASKASHQHSSPSPLRSAFTADFVFDFGSQTKATSHTSDISTCQSEKPLPDVPKQDRGFCIERGIELENGCSGLDAKSKLDEQIVQIPPPASIPTNTEMIEKDDTFVSELAVGSGPGRWAYYSAHKRRYGPRLAVPALPVVSPPPRERGDMKGDHTRGNWI